MRIRTRRATERCVCAWTATVTLLEYGNAVRIEADRLPPLDG
jgi:hypothetical protein